MYYCYTLFSSVWKSVESLFLQSQAKTGKAKISLKLIRNSDTKKSAPCQRKRIVNRARVSRSMRISLSQMKWECDKQKKRGSSNIKWERNKGKFIITSFFLGRYVCVMFWPFFIYPFVFYLACQNHRHPTAFSMLFYSVCFVGSVNAWGHRKFQIIELWCNPLSSDTVFIYAERKFTYRIWPEFIDLYKLLPKLVAGHKMTNIKLTKWNWWTAAITVHMF